MSSHHFVKEGQEPAVMIVGTDLRFEVLGDVLEWSPQVIAVGANQAEWLLSMGIKVDVCRLLGGEDVPSFPYPADVSITDFSSTPECALDWLSLHPEPAYLFGWKQSEIASFFNSMDKSLTRWPVAFSLDRKWICPALNPYCKWMNAGTRLLLAGNPSDWNIRGAFSYQWPILETTHDGVVSLQTKLLGIFGEPLYL